MNTFRIAIHRLQRFLYDFSVHNDILNFLLIFVLL